jgi:hypothetical protein
VVILVELAAVELVDPPLLTRLEVLAPLVLVTAIGKELVVTTLPTPMQYAYPSQKLVRQSFETAGFQAINCACVMAKAVSTE